ncbi:hypothetical protein ACFQ3Z_03725 [Streptomyces nogalater]
MRNALDLSPGSRLQVFFETTLRREGLTVDGRLRVPPGVTSLPPTRVADLAEVAPALWTAVCALLGGAKPIRRPARLGNALICNFRTTGLAESWHVDGDFFVHHPDSPEQALLLFVLWTDVAEGEGATLAAPSATAGILRHLARHPAGLTSARIPARDFIGAPDRHLALTGKAGDAWILHPLTAHQSAPIPGAAPVHLQPGRGTRSADESCRRPGAEKPARRIDPPSSRAALDPARGRGAAHLRPRTHRPLGRRGNLYRPLLRVFAVKA